MCEIVKNQMHLFATLKGHRLTPWVREGARFVARCTQCKYKVVVTPDPFGAGTVTDTPDGDDPCPPK